MRTGIFGEERGGEERGGERERRKVYWKLTEQGMVACLLTDKSTTIVPERKEINIEKCKDLSPAEDLIKKDLLQWGSEAMAIKTSLLILHVG